MNGFTEKAAVNTISFGDAAEALRESLAAKAAYRDALSRNQVNYGYEEETQVASVKVMPTEGSPVELWARRFGSGPGASSRLVSREEPFKATHYRDISNTGRTGDFYFKTDAEPVEGSAEYSAYWQLQVAVADVLAGEVEVIEYNHRGDELSRYPGTLALSGEEVGVAGSHHPDED